MRNKAKDRLLFWGFVVQGTIFGAIILYHMLLQTNSLSGRNYSNEQFILALTLLLTITSIILYLIKNQAWHKTSFIALSWSTLMHLWVIRKGFSEVLRNRDMFRQFNHDKAIPSMSIIDYPEILYSFIMLGVNVFLLIILCKRLKTATE